MNLLDAALSLAAGGTAVFPCNEDKSPRTPRGFHDATTDPDKIRGWNWNGGGLIGAAIPEGTVVVDVDPRNGGEETVATLSQTGRALPSTHTVRTRSGGLHLYYGVPTGAELRSSLGPGVDVKRAGRGYVVVPPSGGYRLELDGPVNPAPAWLFDELAVVPNAESAGQASDPKFFPFEKGTAYGLAAMDRELGRLTRVREGGRNNALNTAAFNLAQLVAGGELDEENTLDALSRAGALMGLEPGEIQATIESGWGAGEQEPRQAPGEETPAGEAPPLSDAEAEGRFWVNWAIDEPELPFYCRPLLPKNAYVLVFGATEASKSMAWVGLLCQGSHVGVRSSVYSLENPPATDRQRVRRWAPDPSNFRLTNEPIDFTDPRQVEALISRESDWGDGRGTDVLMLDTYSHCFTSRSDDGNAKAIEFARRVRYVMHQVGCSVLVVDHTGFEGDEPRDASAKRQQVDVAILMKKRGDWKAGQPSKFSMTNRKSARFANPFDLLGEIRDTRGPTRGLELGWAGDGPRWET